MKPLYVPLSPSTINHDCPKDSLQACVIHAMVAEDMQSIQRLCTVTVITYYLIVRPKVDQRAGQLWLGITTTKKIRELKYKKDEQVNPLNSLEPWDQSVTGQLTDKPTRGQSSRGLDNSRTGQLAEMFDLKFGYQCSLGAPP